MNIIVRASRIGHRMINPIAWRLSPDSQDAFIWSLNNWIAKPWVDYYVYRQTGKTRQEWEDESNE